MRHGFTTKTVTNGNMSTSITSLVSNIENMDGFGFQIDFTSGATGTFAVQVSNNYSPGPISNQAAANAGTWITVPTVDQSNVSPSALGTAATLFLNVAGISAAWCRLVYTRVSGTGTLNVSTNAKGAG